MMRRFAIPLVAVSMALTNLALPAGGHAAAEPSFSSNAASSTSADVNLQAEEASWPMAGANPQRTSWTSEEVRGALRPLWYRPFEPYIAPWIQIIGANNLLYISTSRGLYALDAQNGAQEWVYPTELPLGHSPTVVGNRVYVGALDHRLYALNALTGAYVWSFEASAGFQTNPLVVNGIVYAGNRDGYFYALDASSGGLVWRYRTEGPILYSAAYADGVVYFASDDSRAYALNAQSGSLVWRSSKLPGAGFHSWWPVVYGNRVIFSGSINYRVAIRPYGGHFSNDIERVDVYPHSAVDPDGTTVGPVGQEPGHWAAGTTTIDASKATVTSNGSTTPITEYLEAKPWRRTYFVLNRTNGQEVTYDFDADGKAEYAPILWFGTHGGNRYPPVVGSDGVLYQSNDFLSNPWIPRGHVSGWKMDTPYLSLPTTSTNAVDEPIGYAAGGSLIYWNRCCDRVGASFDITQPGTGWTYFSYNLRSLIPGYDSAYYLPSGEEPTGVQAAFGGVNGVYGYHGDTNAPIPYLGRVYMHRGNSVIAFGATTSAATALSTVQTIEVVDEAQSVSLSDVQARLEEEVSKILAAGHLQPGYVPAGIVDGRLMGDCGDDLQDYWHHPADTLSTLLRALPYLSSDLQTQTRTYLQEEFADYPPYDYNHIGWRDGASREASAKPPEVVSASASSGPRTEVASYSYEGWKSAPYAFYTMAQYAEVFGGAQEILDTARSRASLMNSFDDVPSNSVLTRTPLILNAYIAGYLGYLKLEQLAGNPETGAIRTEANRLLALRASSFSKNTPYTSTSYCRALSVSRNFIFLVPETGQYLREHALDEVQEAVEEYEGIAPYWFVPKVSVEYGEGAVRNLYDYPALFQAEAWILDAPFERLVKFLDEPGVARGDLFFIDNLVAALAAGPSAPEAPAPTIDPPGGDFDAPVTVTLSTTVEGASIRYTLDGSLPVLTSPLYTEPITVSHTLTLRARVFHDDYNPSPAGSAIFMLHSTFEDVPFDHWAYAYIEALHQSGYVVGCSSDPMLFCPGQILSRAESSVFILRGQHGAIPTPPYDPPSTPTFADVATTYWGFGWIESLWIDNLTAGCGTDPLTYCPLRDHTRAEASVFFLRIKNGVSYEAPAATGLFTDVDLGEWYAAWVEAAYTEGLLLACQNSPLRFCPDDPLDRAWAAYTMVMAKGGLAVLAAGATGTPTPTLTLTPTPTPSLAPSETPSETPSPTPFMPPTETATPEPLPSPTETPVPDATQTATPTPTETQSLP